MSFLFIRGALPVFDPFALVELREALAVVALLVYGVAIGRLPKVRAHWRRFLISGLVNSAIPFSLIAFAELELTASLAAMFNSTTVLFTAVVAAIWTGEALTAGKATGVVLGVAVLSTAVAYILYFRLIESVGPTSTVTVAFLVTVFGLLFGVVLLGEPFGLGTLAGLGIVLLSVTLVTGIASPKGKPA